MGRLQPEGRDDVSSDSTAALTTQRVRFEHMCGDRECSQVQAYAEARSGDKRSGALLLVYARRGAARPGEIVIGARLVAMRLESGRENGEKHWSVSIDVRSPATRVAGVEHSHYFCSPRPGEGRRRPFRTDEKGVLDWSDRPGPGAGKGTGTYPRNWSPRMETTAGALGLDGERGEVVLNLVLSEVESENTVRLSGIAIRIPDRMWNERPARSDAVRLLSKLGRFDPSGVWRTLARRAKCRACREARRSAELAFAANWSANDG